MRVIFLMMIGMSLLQADFIKDGDTVKDTQSNLEWQDNKARDYYLTWNHAIKLCENLELAGHSDWRLPNIKELNSIVDNSKYKPAIVEVFKNTGSTKYWSSTTTKSYKYAARFVDFERGFIAGISKSESFRVRCVRGGD